MYLTMSPFYHKINCLIETNSKFDGTDIGETFGQYYSEVGFDLYIDKDDINIQFGNLDSSSLKEGAYGICVAQIKTIIFDYENIINDGISFEDVADCAMLESSINDDLVRLNNAIHDSNIPIDISGLFCYLKRAYVYTEFRNKGIATYIFNNLQKILEYITNQEISTITVFPKPQTETLDGRWKNIKDPHDKMLTKMIKRLQESDFKQIGGSGFYIKPLLK